MASRRSTHFRFNVRAAGEPDGPAPRPPPLFTGAASPSGGGWAGGWAGGLLSPAGSLSTTPSAASALLSPPAAGPRRARPAPATPAARGASAQPLLVTPRAMRPPAEPAAGAAAGGAPAAASGPSALATPRAQRVLPSLFVCPCCDGEVRVPAVEFHTHVERCFADRQLRLAERERAAGAPGAPAAGAEAAEEERRKIAAVRKVVDTLALRTRIGILASLNRLANSAEPAAAARAGLTSSDEANDHLVLSLVFKKAGSGDGDGDGDGDGSPPRAPVGSLATPAGRGARPGAAATPTCRGADVPFGPWSPLNALKRPSVGGVDMPFECQTPQFSSPPFKTAASPRSAAAEPKTAAVRSRLFGASGTPTKTGPAGAGDADAALRPRRMIARRTSPRRRHAVGAAPGDADERR